MRRFQLTMLLSLLLGFATMAVAGILQTGEYYLDTDPGPGHGIAFDPGAVQHWDGTITLTPQVLASLSEGMHDLGIRFKDVDSEWGPSVVQRFEVQPRDEPVLVSAEYFLTDEPGAGQAVPLPQSNQTQYSATTEFSASFLHTLPDGINTLTLRFLDSHGDWSQCQSISFVNPTDRSTTISRLEWAFYEGGQLLQESVTEGDSGMELAVTVLALGLNIAPLTTVTAIFSAVDGEGNNSPRAYRRFITTNPGEVDAIAGAVEASGLLFENESQVPWFPQTVVSWSGGDAVQSGPIGHLQSTQLQSNVNGPGVLKFWWKVSSENNYDWQEFWLDGVRQFRISGEVDWGQRTVNLTTAGPHILKWMYSKDGSTVSGSDAGWLDSVEWIPESDFLALVAAAGLTGNNAFPTAIPFHDGVENLLKYAFNMNLAGPDVSGLTPGSGNSGLPSVTSSGSGENGVLCVEFVQRVGSGLVYTPKKSATLDPESFVPLSDTPTITPIGTDGLWQRVTYDEPVNLNTTPTCFSLVEVTLP